MIAFTDGTALIVVLPSRRSNGVYLVRAEPKGMELIVSHQCPAQQYGRPCSHVRLAAEAYRTWQWWEPEKTVRLEIRRIVLDAGWEQVELPKDRLAQLREWMHDAS